MPIHGLSTAFLSILLPSHSPLGPVVVHGTLDWVREASSMAEELQQRATSGLWVVAAEATATLALQRPQEPTMIIPRSVAARALMNGLEINHASFTSVNHVL